MCSPVVPILCHRVHNCKECEVELSIIVDFICSCEVYTHDGISSVIVVVVMFFSSLMGE